MKNKIIFLLLVLFVNFEAKGQTRISDPYARRLVRVSTLVGKNCTIGDIATDLSNGKAAYCSATNVWVYISGSGNSVSESRTINTTSPLAGGGDLSANRTLTCTTCAITTNGLNQFASTTSLQFLGTISNETGSGLVMGNDTPTIITPTIASFINATHSHQNNAGGGTLAELALNLSDNTANDFSISRHGFVPKGTNVGKFLKDNGSWDNVPIGITGSGTQNYLPKWEVGGGSLEDSLFTEDGISVGIGSSSTVTSINSGSDNNGGATFDPSTPSVVLSGKSGMVFLLLDGTHNAEVAEIQSSPNARTVLDGAAYTIVNTGATSISEVTPLWGMGENGANLQIDGAGRIAKYGGDSPSNGHILIGSGPDGYYRDNAIIPSTGIIITNGSGSITISTDGTNNLNISTKTANYTIQTTDSVLLCDATSANNTFSTNLSASSFCSSGKCFEVTIKKIDSSINTCIFDPNSTELIDGASSNTILTQWASRTYITDGTSWYVK